MSRWGRLRLSPPSPSPNRTSRLGLDCYRFCGRQRNSPGARDPATGKIPGMGDVDQFTQVHLVWSRSRRVAAFTAAACHSSEVFCFYTLNYLRSGRSPSHLPLGRALVGEAKAPL